MSMVYLIGSDEKIKDINQSVLSFKQYNQEPKIKTNIIFDKNYYYMSAPICTFGIEFDDETPEITFTFDNEKKVNFKDIQKQNLKTLFNIIKNSGLNNVVLYRLWLTDKEEEINNIYLKNKIIISDYLHDNKLLSSINKFNLNYNTEYTFIL